MMKPMRCCLAVAGMILLVLLGVSCRISPEWDTPEDKTVRGKKVVDQAMIAYDEFLERIEKVTPGAEPAEVRALLGDPQTISDATWHYDLTMRKGFPGIPTAGMTVFTRMEILFRDGKVDRVSRAWMDLTGPAPH